MKWTERMFMNPSYKRNGRWSMVDGRRRTHRGCSFQPGVRQIGEWWVGLALVVVLLIAGCDLSGSNGNGNTVDSGQMDADDSADSDIRSDDIEVPDQVEAEVKVYPGEPGAKAYFKEQRESFYDQPFPSNLRTKFGVPDITDFPNPYGIPMLDEYKKVAQKRLDGFSPNGAIYFRFDAPLVAANMPALFQTTSISSTILLVNITPTSARYGELIPVETWIFSGEPTVPGYYLESNVLAVRPLGGFPMSAGDTYACIVTRGIKDSSGRHLGQTETVLDALSGNYAAKFYGAFTMLRDWLATKPGIRVEDIAVATVFAVSRPTDELASAAAYISSEVSPVEVMAPKKVSSSEYYKVYKGTYLAPNFLTGDPPYESKGELTFTDDGKPIEQWMEEITYAVAVPTQGVMPKDGWPIVQYSHGTGGNYLSFAGDIANELAREGIASISIDQPLHGERWDGPDINIEFYSFNFTNPWGARSLFRQAALDNVSLSRFIGTLQVEDGDSLHRFDDSSMGYFGHSQGGLTGALFVAVEDSITSAVLSGAGGGLAYTILLRKEIDSGMDLDIKTALEGLLQFQFDNEFTLFHPVLTLAQMLVDVVDPINYSPLYFYPRLRSTPLNLLLTEGVEDPYTPSVTTENLAVAGRIPPVQPIVHSHPGFSLLNIGIVLPADGNMALSDGTTATAALAQYNGYGHFVAFQDDDCIKLWVSLLTSSLLDGNPRISL